MKRIKRIGNYLNETYGGNYAGNVYDRKYVTPNITTMTGGGREPMVIKEWKLELSKQQSKDI